MIKHLFVVAVVSLGLAYSGCSSDSGRTITGTLSLSDEDEFWTHGSPCRGSGGYDDINAGAQVVVKNESGTVIGTSNLEAGKGKDLLKALSEELGSTPTSSRSSSSISNLLVQCEFPFEVEVPDAEFYSIEVSHRGEISYSKEELEDQDWDVGVTLGP